MVIFEYLPLLFKGLLLSLSVALLSLVFSLLIGLAVALSKVKGVQPLSFCAQIYTATMRGVPDLIMMFLIFYGGQLLVNSATFYFDWEYIDIDAFTAGVVTLSLIFGAFMAETFRAAILAVDIRQIETAQAFGMSRGHILWRILIPQMTLHALPGLTNNWLVLVKATAILSVIGLHDIVFVANVASRSTHEPFVFYFAVSLAYLAVTWVSMVLLRKLGDYYHVEVQV